MILSRKSRKSKLTDSISFARQLLLSREESKLRRRTERIGSERRIVSDWSWGWNSILDCLSTSMLFSIFLAGSISLTSLSSHPSRLTSLSGTRISSLLQSMKKRFPLSMKVLVPTLPMNRSRMILIPKKSPPQSWLRRLCLRSHQNTSENPKRKPVNSNNLTKKRLLGSTVIVIV